MQGTRGAGILRGLAFTLVIVTIIILFFIKKLELYTVNWLITEFLPVLIIPVIILFQPEFRRALIKLGHSPFFRMFIKAEIQIANEIVTAVTALSDKRTGGLITIERDDGLGIYIERGVKINSDISSDLISTIFWPGTPLHDGAVIIQGFKIAAAGCLFPLTENENISKTCGTRHRAGIGITEETDAISIIVSEETGLVSVAVGGVLSEDVTSDELKEKLEELSTNTVTENRSG
jgi:diadenylate cyclase